MSYEVDEPIQNSPFEKPSRYWYIQEGEQAELRQGRRRAGAKVWPSLSKRVTFPHAATASSVTPSSAFYDTITGCR